MPALGTPAPRSRRNAHAAARWSPPRIIARIAGHPFSLKLHLVSWMAGCTTKITPAWIDSHHRSVDDRLGARGTKRPGWVGAGADDVVVLWSGAWLYAFAHLARAQATI
ncbi:hypothetical protein LIA77_04266 [Sarocladium implicatum]|nr:hypothetical protein LIA77_04266 [Sarocladium implicatum]